MRILLLTCLAMVAALTAACAQGAPTAVAPGSSAAVTTLTATPQASPASLSRPGQIVLEVAQGTEARYRVKEQLAQLNFPTDAVGITQQVTGAIVLGQSNAVVAGSKLVVDLRTLQTDQSRRDSYVRQNTLETARFPQAEFVPRKVVALPSPLPKSGDARFQMVGDMTIHGVTRPITWDVTATFSDQEVSGVASTSFRFEEFNMSIPRVFSVLSVENNIRLEVSFRLRRTEATP